MNNNRENKKLAGNVRKIRKLMKFVKKKFIKKLKQKKKDESN